MPCSCGRQRTHPERAAFPPEKFAVITTGSEVFKGRIEDKFTPVLVGKLAEYGCEMTYHKTCDDDPAGITAAFWKQRPQAAS